MWWYRRVPNFQSTPLLIERISLLGEITIDLEDHPIVVLGGSSQES